MGSSENVYWAFSSAAQTVGTFVAFLLAGYALVHTMMEAAAQADETLTEIHEALKKRYHQQLSGLALVTAGAILACLSVVYLNGYTVWWLSWLAGLAGALTIASVIGGVLFVVSIVDPRRYRKAAQRLAAEVRPRATAAERAPSTEFFQEFVELERLVRPLWERRAGGERLSRRSGPPTFREMLEALVIAQVLPSHLHEQLLRVSRYRNVVFHGHVRDVDPEALQEVRQARAEVARLLEHE